MLRSRAQHPSLTCQDSSAAMAGRPDVVAMGPHSAGSHEHLQQDVVAMNQEWQLGCGNHRTYVKAAPSQTRE